MTKIKNLAKGSTAALLAVGLLVGLPVILFLFNGWPLSDITKIVNDPLMSDSTRVELALKQGLGVIGWIVWAQILLALPQEIAAYRKGSHTKGVLVTPFFQQLLRKLVKTIFLLGSVFGSATSSYALTPTLPQAVDVTMVEEQPATTAVEQKQEEEELKEGTKTVTIDQTSTLMALTEQELGTHDRWEEVLELNNGREMIDGTVFTEETRFLEKGWLIIIPDDDQPNLDKTTATVVVEEGDSQWSITEDLLEDSWGRTPTADEVKPVWEDLKEVNESRLLPPNDPNMVYPGQQLETPAIPQDPTKENEDTTNPNVEPKVNVNEKPAAPAAEEKTGTTASTTVTSEKVEEVTPASGEVSATRKPIAVQGSRPVSEPVQAKQPTVDTATKNVETGEDADVSIDARRIGSLGLIAGSATLLVLWHRRKKRANRKPGWRPWTRNEKPASNQPLHRLDENTDSFEPMSTINQNKVVPEPTIMAGSDPKLAEDLNATLRTLSSSITQESRDVPDLAAVTINQEEIKLLFESKQLNPPEPFTISDTDNPTFWNVNRRDISETKTAVSLYPTLVTIGEDEQQENVFALDLEAANIVNILSSDKNSVLDTMATWALELAVSPLADDNMHIICIGFGKEIQTLPKITAVNDHTEAEQLIKNSMQTITDAVQETNMVGPEGRANGGDVWTPIIVLDPFNNEDTLQNILQIVRSTEKCGVAAVVSNVAVEPDEWSIELEQANSWDIQAKKATLLFGLDTTGYVRYRQDATLEQRTDIARVINEAATPVYIEEPVLYEVLQSEQENDDTETSDVIDLTGDNKPIEVDLPEWNVKAVVKMLGNLRVMTAGEEIRFDRSQSAGLLAYLTLNRNGITTDQGIEALIPNKPGVMRDMTSRKHSFNTVVSHARQRVAKALNVEGQTIIPMRSTNEIGSLTVSSDIGSDYERFNELVNYAKTQPLNTKIGALHTALELIEGRPFDGYVSRWQEAESIEGNILIAIEETALALARLYLEALPTADPQAAEWACSQGLKAYPESSQLWLKRFEVAVMKDPYGDRPEKIWCMYEQTVTDPEYGFDPYKELQEKYVTWRNRIRNKAANIPTIGDEDTQVTENIGLAEVKAVGFDSWS